jgi:peptide/nickel transport system substrate-binding protein
MGIIPKHIYEKGVFNTNPANRAPIGTGPYKFSEWKTDEKIVLDANPDYFEGKPYINKYIYRIIPDQAVQFLELRKESLDEMGVTPDQWKAYDEFYKNYNKFRYPSFSYVYLAFNLKRSPFNEKLFRQAMAYAVDKKEIIDGVMLGMGKSATGPFPPQSWAYNPSVQEYEHNPQKALAILASLGWKDTDHDGILDKDGKPLSFTIISNQGNKMRSLSAEIIQSQLGKIGIDVKVRIIEWSSFIHQFIDTRNFDAAMMGWSLSRDPDQYAIWNSSQTGTGQYNFISYANPEVDQLLDLGRKTFDRNERQKIYHRIHQILADDQPYLFLYYPNNLPIIHKRFRNVILAPAGLSWNFIRWWSPKNEHKYEP